MGLAGKMFNPAPHHVLVPLLEKHGISWEVFSKRGRPPTGAREKRSAIITELHAVGTTWSRMIEITGLSNGSIQRLTQVMWNGASRGNRQKGAAEQGRKRKGEKKPWLSLKLRQAWKSGKFDFHCLSGSYLAFDKTKLGLGTLCHKSHAYKTTGRSVRRWRYRQGKRSLGDCVECQAKARHQCYKLAPEKAARESRQWYAANKERAKETRRVYYFGHRDVVSAYQRSYRAENAEKIKVTKTRYYRTSRGRELTRRRNARYRLARSVAQGMVTEKHKNALLVAFDWKCPACGVLMLEFGLSKNALTWDHMLPLTRGGNDADTNLLPLCRSCNSSKGNKLLEEWLPGYECVLTVFKEVRSWL